MPNYYFKCDKCGEEAEFTNPISVGPPEIVKCSKCNIKMIHQLGGHFVLRGDNWPGKSITRRREGKVDQEKWEESLHIAEVESKESGEVIKERRKGKESFKEYKKHNQKKVGRYAKNLRKGYRPK